MFQIVLDLCLNQNPVFYLLNCKMVTHIRSRIVHVAFQEESSRMPRKQV